MHVRSAVAQPPVHHIGGTELTVVTGSLSLGGAQRIILDWARRIHPSWKVHLVVLTEKVSEWSVPDFVRVTRVRGDRYAALTALAKEVAATENPVVVCHLLHADARQALIDGGARVVNVVHNAKDGWLEGADALAGCQNVIAVSDACATELAEQGWHGPTGVIRHLPARKIFADGARTEWRSRWNVPADATVIGMVGAVKPQKDYPFALQVLEALHRRRDAYLVILGGPLQTPEGLAYWRHIVEEIERMGLRSRVAMPGFVPYAVGCLPAFDVVLNTSGFEGLSIATLEALANGKPVVASKVGGQGEVGSEGLFLLEPASPPEHWAALIETALDHPAVPAPWAGFPSYRLWTLASLAYEPVDLGKTLFLTENLESGGAQRSLVNLHTWADHKDDWEVVVCGNTSEDLFYKKLVFAGVRVTRSADSDDPFDHAEALVHKICTEGVRTVVFWNLDPKVKLLLIKSLCFTSVKFVDVSPGQNSFNEMDSIQKFEHLIAFTRDQAYERLDALVLKFDGPRPESCAHKTWVIPNGVPPSKAVKREYALAGAPRIVVNGRISASKFLIEIIDAVALLKERLPDVELHIFGGVQPKKQKYGDMVFAKAEAMLGRKAVFYGPTLDAPDLLKDFDAYLVLGLHQGCPNAVLEAMSAAVPVVANDAGGTREQVIDGVTGLLVPGYEPGPIADALYSLLTDRSLAERLAKAGRAHVEKHFSMETMVWRYEELLGGSMQGSRAAFPVAA